MKQNNEPLDLPYSADPDDVCLSWDAFDSRIDTSYMPPVEFGLDGETYEISLGVENQDKMRALLAPFIKAARVVRDERSGTQQVAGK